MKGEYSRIKYFILDNETGIEIQVATHYDLCRTAYPNVPYHTSYVRVKLPKDGSWLCLGKYSARMIDFGTERMVCVYDSGGRYIECITEAEFVNRTGGSISRTKTAPITDGRFYMRAVRNTDGSIDDEDVDVYYSMSTKCLRAERRSHEE